MQFTVLIEFLIPGLITVLLALSLLPDAVILHLRQAVPAGDTATTLLFFAAVSYPVGHLVNFPVFSILQQGMLLPGIRKNTYDKYLNQGIDLADRASRHLGESMSASSPEDFRRLFKLMETAVFCEGVDRFNANDLFYKSIERLARGMFFPLLLAAGIVLCKDHTISSIFIEAGLVLALVIFFGLLYHFLETEEDEIARFFITLTARSQPPASGPPAPPASSASPS